MKLICSVAKDLLPLYLEDMCSEESKAALEEHLRTCHACRAEFARMTNSEIIPHAGTLERSLSVSAYAKKVRLHRTRVVVAVALVSVTAVCLLTLCLLTLLDMHRQANPTIFLKETGVYDLTAGTLSTNAAELGKYVLFTNTQRIQVDLSGDFGFDGDLILWNATNAAEPYEMQYAHLRADVRSCIFDGLSSTDRYKITCSGDDRAELVVSDGRIIRFWHSLRSVLWEITGR